MAAKRKRKASGRSTKPSTKSEVDALGDLPDIETVLQETRVFEPPADFAANAHVSSPAMHRSLTKAARKDPEGFWGEIAEQFEWKEKWSKVLDYTFEGNCDVKWFIDGKTNLSVNCLDRHLEAGRGGRPLRTRETLARAPAVI